MQIHRPLLLVLIVATAFLLAPSPARAQSRTDLLALIPDDFGFCLAVNDLRGNAARWERSEWMKAFRQSPLGRSVFEAGEMNQLAKAETELKAVLGIEWPRLRDDILGDALLFAFRPATAKQAEDGMFVLRARDAELLAKLIERVNALEKKAGKLRAVEERQHRGQTYFRREEAKKSDFYFVKGPLIVVAGSEALIRQVIERHGEDVRSPWPERFKAAGADRAVAALCVNPRAFQPFVKAPEKASALAAGWKALDALFVTVNIAEELEVRLTLQGRAKDMPAWASALFTKTPPPSGLWRRFPESAVLTLAAQNDFDSIVKSILEMMPADERTKLTQGVTAGLAPLTALDLFRDVVPSLGPDWGVCLLPTADGKQMPQALFALAVKPGTGQERVDETLLKGVQIFAGLAVADYNRANPQAPLRVQTVRQDKVEVRYFTGTKLPPGLEPACALKDGFLLLASSPEAIARFHPNERKLPEKETPLLQFAPPELAKLLDQRRAHVIARLRQQDKISEDEAARNLAGLLALLDLFERVTVTQHSEPGQASWSLRVEPRRKTNP